jgi:DNA ligase-1
VEKKSRREFLQLAHVWEPEKHDVSGWFVSEKLDGMRCFWDGGLSRGVPTDQVPWASVVDPKTGRRKVKIKPIATGLWSRYGNPIKAPDWWLNRLPCCPLDGELWAGRGKFQLCRSICAGDEPDPRFNKIVFAVYSTPSLASIFACGEIKNSNMVLNMDYGAAQTWIKKRLTARGEYFEGIPMPKRCLGDDFKCLDPNQSFGKELAVLNVALENIEGSVCYLHPQTQLTETRDGAIRQAEDYLDHILDLGGEGIVIRNPNAIWTPKRHRDILKYKPFHDAEAHLVGFTSGRATDKGSRLLGKIGALIVDYGGKRLELSGLTDAEREFLNEYMSLAAAARPGTDMPAHFQGKSFKVGQTVTFKYRELSDDGIPKEARYWRRRHSE